MKKEFVGWLIGAVVVMVLLPWAAVTFVKSDAGMAVTILLFFAIDPIYTVAAGFFAGRNIKQRWSLPIIVAILFLLGTWIFLDMGEGAFVIYAGVYLFIGMVTMFATSWISTRKR